MTFIAEVTHAKSDYTLKFKNELNCKIYHTHIVQKLICSI